MNLETRAAYCYSINVKKAITLLGSDTCCRFRITGVRDMKKRVALSLIYCLLINTPSLFSSLADTTAQPPRQSVVNPSPLYRFLSAFTGPILQMSTIVSTENPLTDTITRQPDQREKRGFPETYCFSVSGIESGMGADAQRCNAFFGSLAAGTAAQVPLCLGPPGFGGRGYVYLVLLMFLVLLSRSNLPWAVVVASRRGK